MTKPLIASLSNPLVKQARALRQKKARRTNGTFLVEGIHHVGEAVESGWEIEALIYAPDLLKSDFAANLVSRLGDRGQPVSPAVMDSLADKDNPQGILAIVRPRETTISSLQSPKASVALVSPQDPGNVGTILRTIAAVGADALFLLDGGVELYHPAVVRASMGALFWTPVVQTSFAEFSAWARKENCQVIGSSARGDVDARTLVPKTPWVLLLGSEQKGLSAEQLNACDVTVSVPMQGRVSSLNLAVAAGVLLYQLNSQGQV